jgi:hypothetical protein
LIRKLKADPETCEAICWAIAVGLAAREIARRFGISPNSVVAVREAMTERGELEATGKRIDRLLNAFVEVGYERILEGTLNGEIHPGQLPIPVLAADDKRRQRDAGMVVGTERTVAEVTVEHIVLEQEMMRRQLLSSEVQSVAPVQIAQESGRSDGPDTGSDTGNVVQAPGSGAGEAGLDGRGEGGGGGVGSAAGSGNTVGMGGENSAPKAS